MTCIEAKWTSPGAWRVQRALLGALFSLLVSAGCTLNVVPPGGNGNGNDNGNDNGNGNGNTNDNDNGSGGGNGNDNGNANGNGNGNDNDNDNGSGNGNDNDNDNDNGGAEPPPEFGGSAALATGNVGGTEVAVSDTGALPSEGGALESALLEVEVPTILTAQVAHASVIGQGLRTESEASLANLEITVGGHTIALSFLSSTAVAECVDGEAQVDGDFSISELALNDEELTVTTEANQTFAIVNEDDEEVGEIVVNEQIRTEDGDSGEIEVNGLRVTIFDQTEIILVHAEASIECPVEQPTPPAIGDFVTGGGFIETEDDFANFGLVGGLRDGGLFGHFVYIDHGTDLRIRATEVTGYEVVDAITRRIEGECEVNQVGGFTFEVVVEDNGEPGVDDTLAVEVSNGYSASGTLIGGNIQIHEEVVPAGE